MNPVNSFYACFRIPYVGLCVTEWTYSILFLFYIYLFFIYFYLS